MKNACLVGFGAVGKVHAAALSECSDAKFYAVCDIDENRVKECGEKYTLLTYTDFDEMLKDTSIEVVHICTPHYLHKDMAVKALTAGKDIVLEKPVAMNAKELNELAKLDTDRKICVMLQNRTNKCLSKLKDIIDNDQTIGKMTGICGLLTWERTKEYYKSADWRGKWKTEGGGLLINQAVHTLDVIDWLGGGVDSVRASISTKFLEDCIEVEDTADALFKMKNGCRGVFYGTNCYSNNEPMRIEVSFENATFRYADKRLYKITSDNTEVIEQDRQVCIGKQYWGSGHYNVISDFYAGNEGAYPTLKDALHAMKLLYATYESAKKGEFVEVEI